ncbi:unnamed protein product [Knipowitschia caucasica]
MAVAKEPVTFFTVTSYFADIPKSVKKGLNSYNSNRVVNVSVLAGGSVKGKVQASMKSKIYEVEVHVEGQEVKASTCSCAIGRSKCHHVAALLIWAEKNFTRTDVECMWKRHDTQNRGNHIKESVCDAIISAGIKNDPMSPRRTEVLWALSSFFMAQLDRLFFGTGLGWIIAPELPQTFDPSHHIKTFDGLLASSSYGDAEDKALYMLSSLAVSPQQKEAIERATVGQTKNALWMAYRRKRITASNFGLVLAAVKRNSYPPSLFKTLLGHYNLKQGAHACDWGIVHEQKAKEEYMKRTGVTFQESGVFLSDSGLLGGSPDGLVSDDCIIEVKCPYAARKKTIIQAAEAKDFYLKLDEVTGLLKMKQTHNYWHQIQGNLYLTGAGTCHLVVWTPLDLVILFIQKDPAWANNITVLETFYKNFFLPHILSDIN